MAIHGRWPYKEIRIYIVDPELGAFTFKHVHNKCRDHLFRGLLQLQIRKSITVSPCIL